MVLCRKRIINKHYAAFKWAVSKNWKGKNGLYSSIKSPNPPNPNGRDSAVGGIFIDLRASASVPYRGLAQMLLEEKLNPKPFLSEGFSLRPLRLQRTERAGGEMCVDVFHLMEKLYPQKW